MIPGSLPRCKRHRHHEDDPEESSRASKKLRCSPSSSVEAFPVRCESVAAPSPPLEGQENKVTPPKKGGEENNSCEPQSADHDHHRLKAAGRSDRAAQLLLRFSDTIERAKHKMDDSWAASGSSRAAVACRRPSPAHTRPSLLQVEMDAQEEMPMRNLITLQSRKRMSAWLGGYLVFGIKK